MDSGSISDFFKHLAGMRDDEVRVSRDTIVLERVITQSSVHGFVRPLMEALDMFAQDCSSPMKRGFLRSAVRAGVIKAVGYEDQDNPPAGEPRRNLERDFPLAIALAERFRTACPVDPEAVRLLEHVRFRFAEFRPG